MDENQALNTKQQSMITIAAFTANGDLDKLKTALQEGLAGPGRHDWDFWDTYIQRVLDWLPIEKVAQ